MNNHRTLSMPIDDGAPAQTTADISSVVAEVLRRLKEAAPKGGLVPFDFTGSSPMVVNMVHGLLVDKGLVALLAITPPVDALSEPGLRIYVDMSRRRPKAEKAPGQA